MPTRNENTVMHGVTLSRKNLIELVLIVIFLAFGINLLSSQLFSWLGDKSLVIISIGFLLCLLPTIYAIKVFFSGRIKKTSFIACVAYNPLKRELLPIKRYPFSEEMCEYIQAAFAENSALKTRWEKQPLEPYAYMMARDDGTEEKASHDILREIRVPFDENLRPILPPNGEKGTFSMHFGSLTAKENATIDLLSQAGEYFLLEKLSHNLFGYFNHEKWSWRQLARYGRKDIPSVLLSNTFLELFTRPLAERPAFVEYADSESDMITSYEHGGSRYRKLLLVLPKGSTVKRCSDNEIEIETKKLKIRLAIRFTGGMSHISFDFLLYYLGCTNFLEVALYRAEVEISVVIKPWAMLSSAGWQYYHWVDSFLDEIEEAASQDCFVRKINWESTMTAIDCSRNILYLMQKSKAESRETSDEGTKVNNGSPSNS